MALNSHSEEPNLGSPPDYAAHHPNEHPEDWGWHGEWGRAARIAGWVVAVILVLLLTTTHYNNMGDLWLWIFTGSMIVILIWDVQRRKNSWRK